MPCRFTLPLTIFIFTYYYLNMFLLVLMVTLDFILLVSYVFIVCFASICLRSYCLLCVFL